jgi:hypothetical protein
VTGPEHLWQRMIRDGGPEPLLQPGTGNIAIDGWTTEAPDTNRLCAQLLITTDHPDARAITLGLLQLLGLRPGHVNRLRPGRPDEPPHIWAVVGKAHVEIHVGFLERRRPVVEGWSDVAIEDDRVVVIVGHEPQPLDQDGYDYMASNGCDFTYVILPVNPLNALATP